MDLKDILQVVRSGWWLLVAGVLAGAVGAGLVIWSATPLYSSSTRLFVSTSASADMSAAYQGNLLSQQRVASYAELLTGVQVAAAVAEDLDLRLNPDEVAEMVSARVVPDTVILEVTVTDISARRAQEIAASLGRQFTEQVADLETADGATTSTVKVTTVQPADLQTDPVSPEIPRILALGALLGLVLGLVSALVRERLDNSVTSPEHVLAMAGVGMIGTVLEDAQLAERHLIADLDQQSAAAEAYRSIRTNLQFLAIDDPPRVIVISSSLPGEGKSTLAINLATVLAQSGSRVMLVEADLRRPRVTRYMGLISGAGLTNVLAGTAELHEVAQPWGNGRLTVLAAGPMPPNPSEMLGSAHMQALLAELRETNDYVVIDAPPLLPVTDAAVLTALSDGCVLTARYGRLRRDDLRAAAGVLARIDAKLLGVVLNRVPQGAGAHYGYGYEADADRERTRRRRSGRPPAPVPVPGRAPRPGRPDPVGRVVTLRSGR
jgi:succinoglycan biosynthesis transport protein ExoP